MLITSIIFFSFLIVLSTISCNEDVIIIDPPHNQDLLSQKNLKDLGDFKVYHNFGHNFEFYSTIPIVIADQVSGTVHILYKDEGRNFPEWRFAIGLGVIGIIIALLILPISK